MSEVLGPASGAKMIYPPNYEYGILDNGFTEPEPPWPGAAFSLCVHAAIYCLCPECRRKYERELQAILLTIGWMFGAAT